MTKEQIQAKLNEKIPRDVVAKRQAGNGISLDYLEGWYVIARLNEVFGNLNWSYGIDELKLVHSGEVTTQRGKSFTAHYIAQVRLRVPDLNMEKAKIDEYGIGCISYTDVGYGNGSDKSDPGRAHELAAKEAVTDGIKRCAKNLGWSMGLALYNKDQEMVSDEDETTTSNTTIDKIRAAARVVVAQKKLTMQEVKTMMFAEFGANSVEELSNENQTKFLSYLNNYIA